jgi:hypothetical protein
MTDQFSRVKHFLDFPRRGFVERDLNSLSVVTTHRCTGGDVDLKWQH